jgi:putative lipoic acid-binding regulatory protein
VERPEQQPEIEYPCTWTYRVIAADAVGTAHAIRSRLGTRPHRLSEGRTSRTGRYASLELELEVADAADRDELFAALSAMDGVRFVL